MDRGRGWILGLKEEEKEEAAAAAAVAGTGRPPSASGWRRSGRLTNYHAHIPPLVPSAPPA